MADPTDNKVDENKKGRWKTKTYSKQLTEYANQSLREDEKNMYTTIFEEIKETNKIEKVEDLMMLDIAVYDFIRIKRIQTLLMKEGDFVKIKLRGGQEITKAHEGSYLLNAIETQLRNNMKELMVTRKENIKKSLGMGAKDFASFLAENTLDVTPDGKDKKTTR